MCSKDKIATHKCLEEKGLILKRKNTASWLYRKVNKDNIENHFRNKSNVDVEIFADNILVEVVAENISNKLVRLMME